MHRKVATALVVALALVIAGCGGSGTTTLSKGELVRQVEAACRSAQAESQRAAGRGRGVEGFVAAVLAGQKGVLDKVDGITTSGAAKADFEAFKQGVQDRVKQIERVASAPAAEQRRTMIAIQQPVQAITRRIEVAARSLGIKSCG